MKQSIYPFMKRTCRLLLFFGSRIAILPHMGWVGVLVILGVAGVCSAAQPLFFSGSSTYASTEPPITADVNGDNYLDIIVLRYAGGTNMAVLTNNGRGQFSFGRLVPVTNFVDYMTAADFNGDGLADLATGRFNTHLTIMTNAGGGDFKIASSIVTNGIRGPFTAADFNRDGLTDLAAPNHARGQVQVFTNLGQANFSFGTAVTSWFYPVMAMAADINDDGAMDLMSSNFEGPLLMLFTNNGAGRFTEVPAPSGAAPPIVPRDMNNDGSLDLIAFANDGKSPVAVFTNTGTGRFSVRSRVDPGQYISSLASADFNLDGSMDLAIGGLYSNSNRLTVLTNDGTGKLETLLTFQTGNFSSLAAADMNGDGRPDLVVGDNVNTNVTVLLNFLPPSISIRRTTANSVAVSWPAAPRVLFESADRWSGGRPNWDYVPPPFTTNNGRVEFIETSPFGTRIFRLLAQ